MGNLIYFYKTPKIRRLNYWPTNKMLVYELDLLMNEYFLRKVGTYLCEMLI